MVIMHIVLYVLASFVVPEPDLFDQFDNNRIGLQLLRPATVAILLDHDLEDIYQSQSNDRGLEFI